MQSLGVGADGELFLGTADGHIFASKNGADSWELRGRVGSRLDAVVTRLVANERGLFASVWYQQAGGGGVFQSDDRGRSWKLIGLEQEAVRALEIAPSQPQELVAGTRTGVFRSQNAGRSWKRISPASDEELRNIDSIAIDTQNANVIYAGTFHLPWKTTDGGKSWKPIATGLIDDSDVMSMRVDATSPAQLYMSACSGIYRSENRGEQWTKMQGIPYSARRTQAIAQDPAHPKVLYAGTTEGMWFTRDGGENWTRATSKDWIVNSVVVLSDQDGARERVVLGTDGLGVRVSDDGGVTFSAANQGFTHTLVRKLAAQRENPNCLLTLVQRSGWEVLQSLDGGKTWQPLPMPAAKRGKIRPLSASQVESIFASPWGWLLQLDDGQLWIWGEARTEWREWHLRLLSTRVTRTRKSKQALRMWNGTVLGFSQDAVLLSTREGLVRCGESGTCNPLRAFYSGEASAAWVSFPGKELAVVEGGKLGLSSDGGETAIWRDLPVPAAQVVSVDANGTRPDGKAYLSTVGGLWISEDAGQHWKKSANGLPPAQVDQWLRAPGFWVAAEKDGGVYISRDEGANWQRTNQDGERSRFTGLVSVGEGIVLGSSQSEGLLRLEGDGKKP